MADLTKKLTVSFGAFSCTLAGFDDPFPIMRQVVDYFQDLSRRDPSFGAHPERPDTEALAAIAAASAGMPVEAEVSDTGLVLRQSEDLSATDTGTDAAETQDDASAEAVTELVLDPGTPVHADDTADAAPVFEDTGADLVASDPSALDVPAAVIEEPIAEVEDATSEDAAADDVWDGLEPEEVATLPETDAVENDAEEIAVATDAPTESVDEITEEDATTAMAPPVDLEMTEAPEAEATEPLLATDPVDTEIGYEASAADESAADEAIDDAAANEEALPDWASELIAGLPDAEMDAADIEDDAMETAADKPQEAIEAQDSTENAISAHDEAASDDLINAEEEALAAMLRHAGVSPDTDPALERSNPLRQWQEDQTATDDVTVTEVAAETETEIEATVEAPAVDASPAPAYSTLNAEIDAVIEEWSRGPAAAEEIDPASPAVPETQAHIAPDDFGSEIEIASDEDTVAADDAPDSQEPEVEPEAAAAEAEAAPLRLGAPVAAPAPAPLVLTPAAPVADAVAAQPEIQPAAAAAAPNPAPAAPEGEPLRLAFGGAEGLDATRYATAAAPAPAPAPQTAPDPADLNEVERAFMAALGDDDQTQPTDFDFDRLFEEPSAPQEPAAPTPAPETSEAPVAEAPAVEAATDPTPEPAPSPAPLSLASETPVSETPENSEAPGTLLLVPARTDEDPETTELRRFASDMGAASLPDMLEASAAFVTMVRGRASFSRGEVLNLVNSLGGEAGFSHEARIKTFGRLIRSGRIQRNAHGEFEMTRSAMRSFAERASA